VFPQITGDVRRDYILRFSALCGGNKSFPADYADDRRFSTSAFSCQMSGRNIRGMPSQKEGGRFMKKM
jgi:hypothetical protein